MFKKINKILAKPVIRLITIYQYTISPDKGLPSFWLKGRICAHEPHCSKYSIHALKRYGFWPGIFYATDRVLHCTPSMEKKYDPDHYRVVFFSSAPIGVPFLQALANDKRFEVVGVVTQCDKPSGRGMEMNENIIKKTAKKLMPSLTRPEGGRVKKEACPLQSQRVSADADGGFIITPTKLNPEKSEEGKQFTQRLTEKKPDLLVVIAYGKIIPQTILDIPKIAPINIHGSILPKYRGASPIQATLLHNDKETGITIMKMDAGMDTGDMIDILRFTIPFDWTTKELIEEMKHIGPKFLNETLRKYGKKLLGEVAQQEHKTTYCGKIEKESGLINPRTDTIETIYNKYRAFALRPKIYFMLPNDGPPLLKEGYHESGGGFKRIIIEHLKLSEPLYNSNDELPMFQGKELNPAILDIQLKPEGKKSMGRKEFVNGYIK